VGVDSGRDGEDRARNLGDERVGPAVDGVASVAVLPGEEAAGGESAE